MYNLLLKRGQAVAFGLGLILVIVFLASIFSGLEQFNMMSDEEQGSTSIFNFGLMASIVLTIICALAALAFGVFKAISNPQGAMVGIIGIVLLLGMWFLFYSSAGVETSGPVYEAMQEFGVTGGQSKGITASLRTTLVVGVATVLSFIGFEIYNLIK